MFTKTLLTMTRNRRKLLLASLDWTRPKDPPLSLGHASILAHLKKEKINVVPKSWSVTAEHFDPENVVQFALEHADNHTDFGIGAFVWNEKYIQYITNRLNQLKFPGRIILGGSQVSYTKSDLESYYPNVDIFIRGYAEHALAKLMQTDQKELLITGVHYAGGPELGLSATADLEGLPSPYLTGIIPPQPFIRWETQRGCPFRCAFCQHRESDVFQKRRQFSELRIMQEINFFLANSVIQDIAVLDPVFNSGPHYMTVLEKLTQGQYRGKLALQCRLEMVSPEFLQAIDKLNETAHVVLEFGLQTIHRNEERHIQRPNNMKKIKQILAETNRLNIATEVSLIFGLPEQTVESFKSTVEFCKSLNVPTIYAYPLRLHRGTPLYDQKQQLGLIESTDNDFELRAFLDDDHIGHVITSPSFTQKDWQQMAIIAKSLDEYNKENVKQTHRFAPKMEHTLKHTFWNTKTSDPLVSSDAQEEFTLKS